MGKVKAKMPGTDAAPPVKTELSNAWPGAMGDADGLVVMVGVALLFMVKVPLLVATM